MHRAAHDHKAIKSGAICIPGPTLSTIQLSGVDTRAHEPHGRNILQRVSADKPATLMVAAEDSGIGSNVQLSLTKSIVIASFTTIAWYNVLELTILIHSFFKRRAGFYYYSLLVATYGIFLHCLGQFLKFYHIKDDGSQARDIGYTVLAYSGWIAMVTGQSIVLYSRLHLVVQSPWVKWILVYIIADGVILHGVTGVLTFLSNCAPDPTPYIPIYSVVEKIQITMFFIQECVLSGIYIWKTSVMLRTEGPIFNAKENARGSRGRKVILHTLLMSIIIIVLDVTTLGLEFAGLYDIQTSYKGAVYSVKLKIEFTILNQLMNLVKGALRDTTASISHTQTAKSRPRRSIRAADLGHSAGAYSRMDEEGQGTGIKLQPLRAGEISKTTTTEVRIDELEIEKDEVYSPAGKKDGSSSRGSSEVYIIEGRNGV
ncbi:integral membrane protein [Paraphaeosphaeria sporulosa]